MHHRVRWLIQRQLLFHQPRPLMIYGNRTDISDHLLFVYGQLHRSDGIASRQRPVEIDGQSECKSKKKYCM